MTEFKINKYLTLKLESGKTNIYINDELFEQCKYVLLNIPVDEIESLESIQSIDEVIEKLDHSLEEGNSPAILSPEIEFWAHCSNLQAWAEYNYDTRLLHPNLSFPLLKKLTEEGDPIAMKAFKEEIAERYLQGTEMTRSFLEEEGYLECLTWDEKAIFLDKGVEDLKGLENFFKKKIKIMRNVHLNYPSIQIENREVVAIHLEGRHLNEFPEQVRHLTSLKKIMASGFEIETLPEWFGELILLEYLEIYSNHLKSLPESIGRLKNLKLLKMSYNDLEMLPESIGDLCSLKWLDVSNNKLITVPDSIGNLFSLKELYLSENLLKSIPKTLKNLTSIEMISLIGNPIDTLPEFLLNIPSLKKLGIKDTNIIIKEELKKKIEKKKLTVIF